MVVKYSFFPATHLLPWDEFTLIIVLGDTGFWLRGKTASDHLSRFHQFEQSVLHRLQLLLGAGGSRAGAGRRDRRSRRGAGGGADRCNGRGR